MFGSRFRGSGSTGSVPVPGPVPVLGSFQNFYRFRFQFHGSGSGSRFLPKILSVPVPISRFRFSVPYKNFIGSGSKVIGSGSNFTIPVPQSKLVQFSVGKSICLNNFQCFPFFRKLAAGENFGFFTPFLPIFL